MGKDGNRYFNMYLLAFSSSIDIICVLMINWSCVKQDGRDGELNSCPEKEIYGFKLNSVINEPSGRRLKGEIGSVIVNSDKLYGGIDLYNICKEGNMIVLHSSTVIFPPSSLNSLTWFTLLCTSAKLAIRLSISPIMRSFSVMKAVTLTTNSSALLWVSSKNKEMLSTVKRLTTN